MQSKRPLVLAALAAVPMLFVASAGASPADTTVPGLSGGVIKREPVLNLDITGSTLTGPLHSRLTVYNDGLVTSSDCGGFFGFNNAGTTVAPAEAAAKLRDELIAAGGLQLGDQPSVFADVPVTTVTVLKGATNARAHTFSYFVGVGPYADISSLLSEFQSTYVTFCPSINQ